jgi:hypothetical protein
VLLLWDSRESIAVIVLLQFSYGWCGFVPLWLLLLMLLIAFVATVEFFHATTAG